jgi:hypothetical protein
MSSKSPAAIFTGTAVILADEDCKSCGVAPEAF